MGVLRIMTENGLEQIRGGGSVKLDTTLTQSGKAADAKAVGDALDELEAKIGEGGSGGITEETDPTVPAWAKAATKPTYTAAEVGAMAADAPVVKSVNGTAPDASGNVTVEAVGAPGADGKTPERGVDYWTEADKAEIVADVLAALPNAEGASF